MRSGADCLPGGEVNSIRQGFGRPETAKLIHWLGDQLDLAFLGLAGSSDVR